MPGELFKANVEKMENRFMPVIISETGLISYLISGAFYVVIFYVVIPYHIKASNWAGSGLHFKYLSRYRKLLSQ